MKKTIKLINVVLLIFLITTYSCKRDDDIIIELENLEVTIDENPTDGQVIGSIESNVNSALTFSIDSQSPDGALAINQNTGELTVLDSALFDFETNPTITAIVSANEAQNTATVTITVNNVNELSVQDFSTTIDENPTDGQSLGTIQASGDATLTYSITSQSPDGALSINANTGELTVANPTLFDFETNTTITATVSVDNAGNVQTATITINLNDVDEIVAQDVNLTIDENPSNGDVIGALQATAGSNLTYSISFQNPSGAFTINQSTGEISVADATLFDYETNPNMLATISINNGTYSVSKNAFIGLNDIHEVGEYKYGGIIFWINATADEGYVVSLNDQSSGVEWGCYGVNIPGAEGTAIGDGEANTSAIVSSCTNSGIAADLANNTINGFNDWFLPSTGELNEIYNNKATLNTSIIANGGTAFSNTWYWTSTQQSGNANNAYIKYFGSGIQTLNAKANMARVRAIRHWTDF